jgi:hypothetical protein
MPPFLPFSFPRMVFGKVAFGAIVPAGARNTRAAHCNHNRWRVGCG